MKWNFKDNFCGRPLVGLTGGIASGKSTIMNFLAAAGAVVIDCDEVYHWLWDHNTELLNQLLATFSTNQRQELARLVFQEPAKLEQLNQLTHPFIARELVRRVNNVPADQLVIIEATLLFESGLGDELPFNIAVSAPIERRIERLMSRNSLNYQQALARINAQHNDDYRNSRADFIIDNSISLESLQSQCTAALEAINKYCISGH